MIDDIIHHPPSTIIAAGCFASFSSQHNHNRVLLSTMKISATVLPFVLLLATKAEGFAPSALVPITPRATSTISAMQSRNKIVVTKDFQVQVQRSLPSSKIKQSTVTILQQASGAADIPPPSHTTQSKLEQFRKYGSYFCNCFPIWTLLTALTALARPKTFLGTPPSTFPAQIGLLMLCMGISLKPSDFKRVLQRPVAVLLAFVGCYGVMPSLAWGIGKALALPSSLAAGLVLVACINGAQASNLCTYIGQGDLALSVLMTTMTTIGAIVMTPLMGKLMLGQVVPVNAAAIAMSTIQVVLAPILIGMTLNAKFPNVVKQILPFSPIMGVLLTCMLVGTSVAGCAGPILTAGFQLQASAALLHALGGSRGIFHYQTVLSRRYLQNLGH